MIYTTKELIDNGETYYSIKQKVEAKKLWILEKGMYTDVENQQIGETYISKKYPNAILTGLSAYSIYDLTDKIPDKFYLATEQHSFPIRRKDVVQTYQDKSFFEIGAIVMQYEDSFIYIYDLERLLIETVRLKERMNPELYYEVIFSFRKIKNKLDFFKINEYAKKFRNGASLLKKIKEVI